MFQYSYHSSSSSSSSSAFMSPLQDKGFPQPSPLIPIRCLSIPGYSSKTSYLISAFFFLPPLGCHSLTLTVHLLSSAHNVSYLCPLFFLFNWGQDVFKFRLLYSMILFSYFSSLCQTLFSPFSFGHWSFCSRTFIRLQVSDPYVKISRIHWLYIFLQG